MTERIPKLTVLIISFNRRWMLEKCLYALHETSSSDERDIIVWDNASTDDSPEFLGTILDWPGVRVVRSDRNIGSDAIFQMMKLVKTPYWVAFDADCWVETRGWVGPIVSIFENQPDVAAQYISTHMDERADFGVDYDKRIPDDSGKGRLDTFEHVKLDKLSRPRFRSENLEFLPAVTPVTEQDRPFVGGGGAEFLKFCNGYWVLAAKMKGPSIPGTPMAGTGTVWRTDVVKDCKFVPDSGIMTDIAGLFYMLMLEKCPEHYFAIVLGMRFYHAYGPWWYIGETASYWKSKSEQAPKIYNRSFEKQYSWLEQAKLWSGWGRGLPNANDIPELKGGT